MPHLGSGGSQEFSPYGRVKEEMPNFDPRPGRAIPVAHGSKLAAMTANLRPALALRLPRLQHHLPHAADRRQRLAAKAQGPDAKQVVRPAQLARRMARKG